MTKPLHEIIWEFHSGFKAHANYGCSAVTEIHLSAEMCQAFMDENKLLVENIRDMQGRANFAPNEFLFDGILLVGPRNFNWYR